MLSTETRTFAVGDRVVVTANSPLTNLIGRFGTVIRLLDEPTMYEVRLDNLISKPDVPFYPSEILQLNPKEDDVN
jgi:hypothetical protein